MMKKEPQKAVVLVSGGLDSTVCLAKAKALGFETYALTFSYGQRHSIELKSARDVAARFGVKSHLIFELNLRLIGGSALTDNISVPKNGVPNGEARIPITYVPARNLIFLSIALSWAEKLGANDLFIGVSAVDYSGYPDCRPEFISEFEKTANLGTRSVVGEGQYQVHTPLIGLSKAQTIEMGLALGVDFGLTWTCYDPDPDSKPCGACESCQLRQKGFLECGMADPLVMG